MYFHYAHTGMRTGCVPIFHKKYDQAPSLVGCAVQQNLRCEQIHLRMSDSPMLESICQQLHMCKKFGIINWKYIILNN